MEFDGYQQFKIALARELSAPLEQVSPSKNANGFSAFVEEIFNEDLELLKNTKQLLDVNQVKKAVEIVSKSERVLLFGVGRSAAIAKDGSLKFALLGIHAADYSDPHAQVMIASGLTSSDVVMGISHSGAIRDIVKSLEIAKDNESKTIAITAGINSPITKVADVVLHCGAGKEHPGNFLDSRIGELAVINVLYRSLILQEKSELDPHLKKLYDKVLKPKRF